MNLTLGVFIPLANERKNFFKVPTRLQYQNGLKPLRFQGVLNTFEPHRINQKSQFRQFPYLQSDLVENVLKFDDCYIKINKSFSLKQQITLNSFKMSLFGLPHKKCKTNGEFVCQASLNSKKNTRVKTLVLVKTSLGFFQSCRKTIYSTRPCIHLNMAFNGQPVARLLLADKETVKPSEIFSLLGLVAQNLASSPLEQLGSNPELF